MLLDAAPIHPQVPYPMVWAALAAGLVVLGLATATLGVLRRRSHRPEAPAVDDSLARCRAEALAAIGRAAGMADPHRACQRIGQEVRRFVGVVSGGDADYSSAARLSLAAEVDHRLEPAARFTCETQDACFDPAAHPDVADVADRAREVVLAWR